MGGADGGAPLPAVVWVHGWPRHEALVQGRLQGAVPRDGVHQPASQYDAPDHPGGRKGVHALTA
jgi:hypothetical protein